jgi:MFS-type transporter involved in bile tolerance (Atg22 family)
MSTGQIWAGVVSFCLVVAIGSAIMWRLTRDDRRRQL